MTNLLVGSAIEIFFLITLFMYATPQAASWAMAKLGGANTSAFQSFRKELKAGLFGIGVGALIVSIFGISPEQFVIDRTKDIAGYAQRLAGVDKQTVCERRVATTHKFTSEAFPEFASNHSNFQSGTFSEAQSIGSIGFQMFALGPAQGDICHVRDAAIAQYCSR